MNRSRTLLTGVAIRPLAQSARRAGADAASVDYFGDRDHRRDLPVLALRDRAADGYSAEALVRLCGRVEASEVAYGADLENHPELVARLAAGRRLLGNPPDVLRRVRDPSRLRAALRAADLPAPEVVRHGEPPPGAPGAWLRKPLRGGGGAGVRPWRAGEKVEEEAYLQRRIRGAPVSLLFLSDGRSARLLAAADMLVGREAFGARGFRYCGSLLRLSPGHLPLPPAHADTFPVGEARRMAAALTSAFGLRGLNGVDAVLSGGRLWAVEVNPRWTASMELLEPGPARGDAAGGRGAPARPGGAAGPTLFGLHRRACLGALPGRRELGELEPGRRWRSAGPVGAAGTYGGHDDAGGARRPLVVGKALLRAPADGRVPDLEELEGPPLADLPEPGERVPAGGPVCTILAAGRDRAGCLARLEAAAARIRDALT